MPSAAYEAVADHFSADEIAALVALIVAINAWNQHEGMAAGVLRAISRDPAAIALEINRRRA